LGCGGWGMGPTPQSPIPNPQSPSPIPNLNNIKNIINTFQKLKTIFVYINTFKIKIIN
jgi:hypothetical protein